jgi:hypothetical protein
MSSVHVAKELRNAWLTPAILHHDGFTADGHRPQATTRELIGRGDESAPLVDWDA